MITVFIIIHLIIVVALVGTVLIQKSDGGALSGLGGGGMDGAQFLSGRAATDILAKATKILGVLFVVSCINLVYWLGTKNTEDTTILDDLQNVPTTEQPVVPSAPAVPSTPDVPEVPTTP